MINYIQFKEKIKKRLKILAIENGIEITNISEEVQYNINKASDVLKIEVGEKYFYLDISILFSQYEQQNLKLKEIYDIVDEIAENTPSLLQDPSDIIEIKREDVLLKLIYTQDNVELLKELPHRDYLDLSIIYFLVTDKNDEMMKTVLITNEMLEKSNLTENQLYRMALSNTQKMFPLDITNTLDDIDMVIEKIENGDYDDIESFSDFLNEDEDYEYYEDDEDYEIDEYSEIEDEYNEDENEEINIDEIYSNLLDMKELMQNSPEKDLMFYIHDEQYIMGSIALIYNSKIHEVAEMLDDDVYVFIPTNKEAMVCSVDFPLESMLEYISTNIDSFLTNGLDQLISFSIYKYEKDTRKISIEMDFATVIEKVKEILGQEDIEDL